MAQFRTEVNITESTAKLNYNTPSLWVGSCFTENIGRKMEQYKLPVQLNPFGILYNPISVLNCLKAVIGNKPFAEDALIEYDGLWQSLQHHGAFSGTDKADVLEQINRAIEEGYHLLQEASFLYITFGTAWVYEWKETGEVVGNCHKIPGTEFDHRILTQKEIVDSYVVFLKELFTKHPQLQVVFTVSPVRHWKNGAAENQRSKAILLVAIHKLVEQFPNCHYFPAYELMMDDLRDYRFYNEDMLHPNHQATEYIWGKFCSAYFEDSTLSVFSSIDKIVAAAKHIPFKKESKKHQQFVQKTIALAEDTEKQHQVNLSAEKALLVDQLA